MPRYFFHVSGLFDYEDNLGTDLISDDAAWSLALFSTGEMLKDLHATTAEAAELVTRAVDETGRNVALVRLVGEKLAAFHASDQMASRLRTY